MIRKNSGFTLLELMITLAIFAVLASIGTVSYLSWLPKYRLKSAADDVYGTLQRAKLHAIKNRVDVIVSFDPYDDGDETGNYIVFEDDDTGGFFLDAGEQVIEESDIPSGIAVETTFADRGVQFNSRGMVTPAGSITLADDASRQRQITLLMNGNVRVTQ